MGRFRRWIMIVVALCLLPASIARLPGLAPAADLAPVGLSIAAAVLLFWALAEGARLMGRRPKPFRSNKD